MSDLTEICAPGTRVEEEMVPVSENVKLKLVHFYPQEKTSNPPVLFIAGWITLIEAWKDVLHEMTKDFEVHYVETREKMSSQVSGKVNYGVEDIGKDIAALVAHFKFKPKNYILFGSSLGATAILDSTQHLPVEPLCLVLIGPNAVFRVPRFGKAIIFFFYPGFYAILKPFIKWYLKNFRLDVEKDYAQYEKYCRNIDAADPWKLKKAAWLLAKYAVWDLLPKIEIPTLIAGASHDTLHEPENLKKIVSMMPKATYIDLETNKRTHQAVMVEKMREYIKSIHK